VLCPQEVLLDGEKLAEVITRQGVNLMWFTSAWLNELVDRHIGLFAGLRTIVTGGEKLSPVHINALRSRFPELNVVSVYGPTENTTFSLYYPITSSCDNIPIGRPITNSTVYVLDANGQLSPSGVVGEICVGGPGLARGTSTRKPSPASTSSTTPSPKASASTAPAIWASGSRMATCCSWAARTINSS
jgi:non-ribosomal peptide synthetase component F